jgi:beta-lactam-binding protein with PASTA domain
MTYDRANQELLDAELRAIRVDEENSDVAEGIVIRTDPASGESVNPNQEIQVYVSLGQEMATIPPLEGLGRDAAAAAIADAGLELGTVTQRNDAALAAGTVISADQPEGSDVPAGTVVNLVVASGKVTINDVRGYTVEAAQRELEELELTVSTQEDTSCAGSAPPTVATQSLAPGDVPIHSEIVLGYCSGS